jgi:hypothetical protein
MAVFFLIVLALFVWLLVSRLPGLLEPKQDLSPVNTRMLFEVLV